MLKYLTTGAVISVLLLGSMQASALTTDITDLLFEINTKDDDKDKGEPINFQILKDDKIVVYDSGWIFNWLLKENSYNYKRAPWGGTKIIVPITTDDCPKLKLRVEKMGDNSWKATFQVRANERQLVLLAETPTVLFGKGHPILPEKPEGVAGAKVTHWNGGNVHIFGLNCLPAENK